MCSLLALGPREGAQQLACLLKPLDGCQLIVGDRAQHLLALLIVLDLLDDISERLERFGRVFNPTNCLLEFFFIALF